MYLHFFIILTTQSDAIGSVKVKRALKPESMEEFANTNPKTKFFNSLEITKIHKR